jgi:1-acyl-sn-glycerol-3-phosphate acyltransferase
LPTPTHFVVKAELARSWLTRVPLDRLQVLYVERRDTILGVAGAHRAAELLRAGRSLLFFPEGTLTRVPGLQAFHLGAFVAAAKAGVPLRPLAITGTRSILRDGSWLPRRGAVSVRLGPARLPAGTDFTAALELRDAARAFILANCGEPDAVRD